MPTKKQTPLTAFTSRHFQLYQLTEGVYAAINADEGWAICNAGIIDLGDRTLVYDTFTSPQAADDLCNAAEYLTGRPASMLVNSHYHNDHIWGNQAFGAQVDIISTTKTRDLIITEGASEIKWYSETAQKQLEALEAQYAQTKDENDRHQLKFAIADYQATVAALPILHVRLPNLTFTNEMTFHGSKHSARLIAYENAHSGSDAILHLPDDRIVFMEDTLFIDIHPYLADGDPDVVQRVLADVKALQPSIVVPGHRPLGSSEHLDILDGYINKLKMIATEAVSRNLAEDKLVITPVPKEYQHFLFKPFFATNLRFLYRRIKHL